MCRVAIWFDADDLPRAMPVDASADRSAGRSASAAPRTAYRKPRLELQLVPEFESLLPPVFARAATGDQPRRRGTAEGLRRAGRRADDESASGRASGGDG